VVLYKVLAVIRQRSKVSNTLDEFLLVLRKVVSETSNSDMKDLSDLDDQIKLYMSENGTCEDMCQGILDIISEHISTLGPRSQVL
jgi:hypothetical protein